MKTVVAGQWSWRSDQHPETKKLWQARNDFDLGRASRRELDAAADNVIKVLIHELESAGVDIISDGGIRWDSVYDTARGILGCYGFENLVRIGGPSQAVNIFARQPSVWVDPLSSDPILILRASILARDLSFSKAHTSRPIVISLPGPYSLARFTTNVSETGLYKLANAYAEVLNSEICELQKAGADIIRIEEPQILNHKEDFVFFRNLARRLTYGLDSENLALATWFRGVDDLPQYFQLPFGIFFVDFVGQAKSFYALCDFPKHKRLAAGIFDARHSYPENDLSLVYAVESILQFVPEANLFISANTDLQFMPWEESMVKVKNMVRFAKEWGGGNG